MVPAGASTVREKYLDNKQTQVTLAIATAGHTCFYTPHHAGAGWLD